jgi:hypothetical protein
MNNVMGSLIDRNAVEIFTEYEYGNLNMAERRNWKKCVMSLRKI